MELQLRTKGNFQIVDLVGEIANIKDGILFKKVLEDIVEEGNQMVAVNFEKSRFLTSPFLNAILSTHHALRKAGGELVLIGNDARTMEAFDVVGVPLIMSVYADEESFATAHLKTAPAEKGATQKNKAK